MHARIVVLGHGDTPAALLDSARMIAGDLEAEALGLAPGERPQDYAERLTALLDDPRPTVLLTDLRGGTPDNVALVVAKRRSGTHVLSNVNLPVLLETCLGEVELTRESLEELCGMGRTGLTHYAES